MITKAALWADTGSLEIILGSYQVGRATRLLDPSILQRAQEYRRQSSARMIPFEQRDIATRLPAADYHVSRKIDGEFTLLVWRDGQAFSINPGGTVRVGLAWQEEAARLLEKANISSAIFAGELYAKPSDERRARIHDILTIARQPRDQAELDRIAFAVFDIVSLDDEPKNPNFSETWRTIERIFGSGKAIHPVEAVLTNDNKVIEELFQRWVVNESAEGLIARSDTTGIFKIKPRHNLDLAVIGFTESIGDRQGLLHDLLVAVRRADGTYQVATRVGGGFTDDDRRAMLSDLKDLAVDSTYAEVNSDHVAYQMVSPEWVIEVSCLDMVSQTTRGSPVQRMVLQFEKNGSACYETIRPLPLASLISPQFVRRREDKTVAPEDVRIQQISQLVDVPLADKDARRLTRPQSTPIHREVYTKELKGQTMVRKFVLWATNKAEDGEDFLAYVLHFTDFSPNRKTPLERDIRVSNSIEQIEKLMEDMKAENIKQGWKPYVANNTKP